MSVNIASAFNDHEGDNDDDPQLAQAIAASLEETSVNKDIKTSAEFVASQQQESLSSNIDDEVKIAIQRKGIYSSTVRAINRPSFNFFKTVRVNFSGEDAIDGGGPRREFFRLLMKSLN